MADVEAQLSNVARKFEFLQERAQRRPIREASLDVSGGLASKKALKTNISSLKEYYLQRLSKTEPNVAARLGAKAFRAGSAAQTPSDGQPQASGQHTQTGASSRPTFSSPPASAPPVRDIEDLEIMCNNCFNLIKSSEAALCTGEASSCPIACRAGGAVGSDRPAGAIPFLDFKLQKLRSALEARIQDQNSKVSGTWRHLAELRYHIDTALKWTPGCSEIGILSDRTVQQVKQLVGTSRVLAPAVYIFSKRIQNVVVQKERELRREQVQGPGSKAGAGGPGGRGAFEHMVMDVDRDTMAESVVEVNSIVSELDSDCGTQYAETLVTQDGASADVGNIQEANDYLSLKNEDEQRRWFYQQCLTIKLACPDKDRARKTLISDLYSKVKSEGVAIDNWIPWIREQLMPEGTGSATAGGMDLDATAKVPGVDGIAETAPASTLSGNASGNAVPAKAGSYLLRSPGGVSRPVPASGGYAPSASGANFASPYLMRR
eukprot:TRINITY_DN122055_c0_g1_i1.p1 TRINITY_DN122055_c0_g1~~TRINITY_DN122055_c0_g1_i1.p1  ORF type:complete len:524 (+),score=101.42 TRINITY_DN122055_c0_g1_i1:105-1574(+)